MEILHTLLSFVTSFLVAGTITLGGLISGNLFAGEQSITILPPSSAITTVAPPAPTASSLHIIGTSTPAKNFSTPKTKKPEAKPLTIAQPSSSTQPVQLTPSAISADDLNTQTRSALVNILCLSQGGNIHSISGSGVFVDSRGVILTNAHIGQLFLLKDYPSKDFVDCTIRIGSPAQPTYRAVLLYLPPAWVTDNASQITVQQAKGTGQNDYAFLLVTGTTGPDSLPPSFPHLPMVIAEPDINVGEFLAAYPAGFLDGSNIEKNLYVSSAYAAVKELFTFGNGREIDLVSVGGTVVSQGGSSGGAMVRTQDGKLQGIIVTATSADTTSQRDLRAITLAHIDRSLVSHGQGGVVALLSQNLTEAAARFASTTAQVEKAQLVKILEQH